MAVRFGLTLGNARLPFSWNTIFIFDNSVVCSGGNKIHRRNLAYTHTHVALCKHGAWVHGCRESTKRTVILKPVYLHAAPFPHLPQHAHGI